jgi:hypothetical protein
MNMVMKELKQTTNDVEFIFKRLFNHMPIILPILMPKIMESIKLVLPDFRVFIDVWVTKITTIVSLSDKGEYIILRRDSVDGSGFLAHLTIFKNSCKVHKGTHWPCLMNTKLDCVEKLRQLIKSVMQDIMGYGPSFEVCTLNMMPFSHCASYIERVLGLFDKYAYKPHLCPPYVFLLV